MEDAAIPVKNASASSGAADAAGTTLEAVNAALALARTAPPRGTHRGNAIKEAARYRNPAYVHAYRFRAIVHTFVGGTILVEAFDPKTGEGFEVEVPDLGPTRLSALMKGFAHLRRHTARFVELGADSSLSLAVGKCACPCGKGFKKVRALYTMSPMDASNTLRAMCSYRTAKKELKREREALYELARAMQAEEPAPAERGPAPAPPAAGRGPAPAPPAAERGSAPPMPETTPPSPEWVLRPWRSTWRSPAAPERAAPVPAEFASAPLPDSGSFTASVTIRVASQDRK